MIAMHIPSSSQTVGPYFLIGLEYLIDRTPALNRQDADTIELHGRVLDGTGATVPDAMLEFWTADPASSRLDLAPDHDSFPRGFRRVATDDEGRFSVLAARPVPLPLDSGATQAPHLLVLVFARGLLRHLISRVYLAGEAGNTSDPVLLRVPPERRTTLIAQPTSDKSSFRWDVILQGADETVFFAW